MSYFWLSNYILLTIIVIITATTNVGLRTQQGMIYGRQTQSSIEYLGIQYAKAERWKPPIDLASEMFSNGSLQATSFGPCCPQPKTDTYIPEQDEQCLYLNIYKPIVPSDQSSLPVFVWIHGGAHEIGCSSQSIPLIYNGTNMISNSPSGQPVIISTINYRLGTLDELARIREDDDRMRIHALLVSERLLITNGHINHFISLIIKQSSVYQSQERYHRCLQLRLYTYPLIIETKHKEWNTDKFHKEYLLKILYILFKILHKEGTVPSNSLELVWTWTKNRANKTLSTILMKLLFIAIYIIESKKVDRNEQRIFLSFIRRAIHQKLIIGRGHIYPLFNYFIHKITIGEYNFTCNSIRYDSP
ncbi:unnamed protein product [Adineta steineri]|uniref:Carboxylesterase type B domain-containing protein n=1 Tax=Adineta steineri TaxID=433720 RepID=A0A814BJ17_9BILA|nr:unnamed protein product [Adineta steineri]